jgi:hypothetical protein
MAGLEQRGGPVISVEGSAPAAKVAAYLRRVANRL